MKESEFKKLIKKDLYQVFLFSCPAHFPLVFARHHWFVTNNKGKLNRWEVMMYNNLSKQCKGHVCKNHSPVTQGINKFIWRQTPRWKSKLKAQISGKKGSIAEKMVIYIEKNAMKDPLKEVYHIFPGPNSNTFIQWIINKFPKSGFKLGWRAIGKNYKTKR